MHPPTAYSHLLATVSGWRGCGPAPSQSGPAGPPWGAAYPPPYLQQAGGQVVAAPNLITVSQLILFKLTKKRNNA